MEKEFEIFFMIYTNVKKTCKKKYKYLSKYTFSSQWHLSVPAGLWGRHHFLKTQSSLWKGLLSVVKKEKGCWTYPKYCEISNQSLKFWNIPYTLRISGLMSTTLKSGHRSTNTLTGSALCPVLLSWTIHPYTYMYPGQNKILYKFTANADSWVACRPGWSKAFYEF